MYFIILCSIAVVLILLLAILTYFVTDSKSSTKSRVEDRRAPAANVAGARRRNIIAARNRARQHIEESDEDENNAAPEIELPEGKIGAKKMAKLQAKAEKKAQREAENNERQEKKKRQELADAERKKQEDKEKQEEAKRAEEERKIREEKELREHEEYLKMKSAFSVEEEGYEVTEESGENLLQDFVKFIKDNKVVVLEDLATRFNLKTQNVIDRIQDLQNDHIITGVIDDRGKFIYISQDELETVAKFVKQRGRVSITELADSSNQLINMNPNICIS